MSGFVPVGAPFGGNNESSLQQGGRRKTRRNGMSVKALKRALKKAGLKTTGRKATLTKRAKKAHLMRGGGDAKTDAAAALTAAVKAGGDYSAEETAALAAGWTRQEVDQVIADANADAAGGRRTRHKRGRRHFY